MKTTGRKSLWAACFFLIEIIGCGHSELDDVNKNATVVARCENIVTNGLLIHRVIEIWRDNSDQGFPYKKGDVINVGIPVDRRNDVGEESLLIYEQMNGKLRLSPRVLNIHSGRVCAMGNIHVSDMQHKLEARLR